MKTYLNPKFTYVGNVGSSRGVQSLWHDQCGKLYFGRDGLDHELVVGAEAHELVKLLGEEYAHVRNSEAEDYAQLEDFDSSFG